MMITGLDGSSELVEFLRPRCFLVVTSFGVLRLFPNGAAAEQLYRVASEEGTVPRDELFRFLHPVKHVESAANDKSVVLCDVADGIDFCDICFDPLLTKFVTDEIGNAFGGSVLARISDANFHTLTSNYQCVWTHIVGASTVYLSAIRAMER